MRPREELNFVHFVAHAFYVRHVWLPQSSARFIFGGKKCRDKRVIVTLLGNNVMILVWYFRYFQHKVMALWPEQGRPGQPSSYWKLFWDFFEPNENQKSGVNNLQKKNNNNNNNKQQKETNQKKPSTEKY